MYILTEHFFPFSPMAVRLPAMCVVCTLLAALKTTWHLLPAVPVTHVGPIFLRDVFIFQYRSSALWL